jgi:hypothetical protein
MISDKSALGLGLFGLMPLSTIFKLYGGGQFHWCKSVNILVIT